MTRVVCPLLAVLAGPLLLPIQYSGVIPSTDSTVCAHKTYSVFCGSRELKLQLI